MPVFLWGGNKNGYCQIFSHWAQSLRNKVLMKNQCQKCPMIHFFQAIFHSLTMMLASVWLFMCETSFSPPPPPINSSHFLQPICCGVWFLMRDRLCLTAWWEGRSRASWEQWKSENAKWSLIKDGTYLGVLGEPSEPQLQNATLK